MPIEPQEPVVEPTEPEVNVPETPTIEELMQQLADKDAMFETQKNEIAGLNKAISKRDQEKLDLLKLTETAEETAKRESEDNLKAFEAKQNELATKEIELRNSENSLNVKLKATELGISLDVVASMKLTSIEQLEAFKKYDDERFNSGKLEGESSLKNKVAGFDRANYNSEGNASQGFPSVIKKALQR